MVDDYSDSNKSEETRKSKYNSALAQLYRMDDLWKDTHRHSRDTLYGKWNEDLDRVWMELSSDASPEQKEQMMEINKKIDSLFIYCGTSKLKLKAPVLYARLINMQKKMLMDKEEVCRKIQDKQGKGSAYEDDIEDYMD